MVAEAKSRDTVLVVDERGVADLFSAWLEGDYDVLTASSGPAAVEAIDESVDVVLVDRDLPDLAVDDLFVTLERRGSDCRVVLVSGGADSRLDLGFDAHLEKPVSQAELLAVVDRLLDCESHDALLRELSAKRIERNVLLTERSTSELMEEPRFVRLERDIEALEARLEELRAS